MAQACLDCGLCQEQCLFLRRQGSPGQIARGLDPQDPRQLSQAYLCSLCGLCGAVCPQGLDPAAMFLDLRRQAVAQGTAGLPEHQGLLAYERRGNSPRYTWYALPAGCRAVFFPGCNLPGSRPQQTWRLFELLRGQDPSLGLVLDCCNKPSHDLGRQEFFLAMFGEMHDWLLAQGVREVLVACPNCHRVFETHGQGLTVRTVYQALAEAGLPAIGQAPATVTVHDPCVARQAPALQQAARHWAAQAGLAVEEMSHHGAQALCCGEGGGVGFVDPELAQAWARHRGQEAEGRRVLTYCAGCAGHLGRLMPVTHLTDLLLDTQAALAGRAPASKAPFTYLNRLRLKKRAQDQVPAAITRQRTFNPQPPPQGGLLKLALTLLALAGLVAAVRLSGAAAYLEPERLRGLIAGHGVLAPAIYMLIYTLAPALFLPGLPITLAGGVLFGPLWGVVYTIIGSTAGACLAFLVARHGARGGIERRLTGPRWRQLDAQVERHGWKVVLFARLMPLLPFNLLNYALGLTKIRFSHYALATFWGMLPACIAFVVFSSSLLDLLLGRVSPGLVLGLLLVLAVMLVPMLYRRRRAKRALASPKT
ncbi:MAG: VTT domain-containing protein [Desulfarculus sp.]|nr:VTT domain-containing protein [Desulfarculus sp.]